MREALVSHGRAEGHAGTVRFGETLAGHLAMRVLAKRLMYVSGRKPRDVEVEVDGPDMSLLDETVREPDGDGGMRKVIKPWTPAYAAWVIANETDERKRVIAMKQSGLWGRHATALCREAIGEAKSLMAMTKADMYRICVFLCDRIDEKAEPPSGWYPDGWKATYDLIRHGAKKEEPRRPNRALEVAQRSIEAAKERSELRDAIDYVADQTGLPRTKVVELARANLEKFSGQQRRAVLALMDESPSVARTEDGE